MGKVVAVLGVVVVVVVGLGLWLAFSIENHGVDPDVTVTVDEPSATIEDGDLVRFELKNVLPSRDDWQWELPKGLDESSRSTGGSDTPPWVEVDVEELRDYEVTFQRCPSPAPCDEDDVEEEVTFRLRAA